jgi:4-hydroxy-tetrahydrodipicolinate synthase
MKRFTGITSALVTPFGNDLSLDVAGLRANVRHQIAAGIHGFCPLGGTGEPLSLTPDELRRVVDAVLEEAGGKAHVIVGCLVASQPEIISLGKYAKEAGADAIMVIPPYFYWPKPRHIRRHFEDIAERVDLPMVLFNGPTRAGIKLEPGFVLELVEAIPQLVAIKEATGDLAGIEKLIAESPRRFTVLQGYDELIHATTAIGGRGGIVSLGCLVPRLLVRLFAACEEGKAEEARRLQQLVVGLSEAIYAEPNPAPLKYAMNRMGLAGGRTRPPLYPIADETAQRVDRALDRVITEERAGETSLRAR